MRTDVPPSRRRFVRLAVFVLTALLGGGSTAAQSDGADAPSLRPKDSLWIVNTRSLGWPQAEGDLTQTLPVWRYAADGGWTHATAHELAAALDAGGINYFHIHGNRIEHAVAIERGWAVYQTLARRAPEDTPLRAVIWSWPSSQVRGQLRDVRAKAYRTDAESGYLAALLRQIDPHAPLSFAGHSYGARIITGALHLDQGGSLGGLYFPEAAGRGAARRARVVFTAAALHHDWLSPGRNHGEAMHAVERLLNLYNSCDPVLRYYRFVDRCAAPLAAGYAGIAWYGPAGEDLARIAEIDVAPIVGREHFWQSYFSSPTIMDEFARCLLQPADP